MSEEGSFINLGWGFIIFWLGVSLILSVSLRADFLTVFSIGAGVIILLLSLWMYVKTESFPIIPSLSGILILIFGLYLMIGRPEIFLGIVLIIIGLFILIYELFLKR
jgi:hypothetical protein